MSVDLNIGFVLVVGVDWVELCGLACCGIL